MTVIFKDGFDAYAGSGNAFLSCRYGGSTTGWTLVTGRYGGQAARQPASAGGMNSPTFSAVSSFTFVASVRCVGLDSDQNFAFYSAGTRMLGFTFNTDRTIGAYRDSTLLGSSATNTIPATNTWFTLEIECVIHDTTGSVKVYCDGTLILNLTGVDTRNGTPTTVDNWRTNPAATTIGSTDWDDLYIIDSATKPADVYRIETVAVNADGATLNWTPSTGTDHYAVVDELPVSTTDYLQTSTLNDVDELEVGTLSTAPSGILAVQAIGFFEKTDVSTRACAVDVKSSSSTGAGTGVNLSTSGTWVGNLLNTDPATSTAWTQSGVENAKLRPKVTT